MMEQMWNSRFWKLASCKLAFFLTMLVLCFFFLLCDKNRWVLLQERVGHLEKPFRISLEYIAGGNQSVAAIDSFAMKNCSTGKGSALFHSNMYCCLRGYGVGSNLFSSMLNFKAAEVFWHLSPFNFVVLIPNH